MQALMMIVPPWKPNTVTMPALRKQTNIYPLTLTIAVAYLSMMAIFMQAMVFRTSFIPMCHVWYVYLKSNEINP